MSDQQQPAEDQPPVIQLHITPAVGAGIPGAPREEQPVDVKLGGPIEIVLPNVPAAVAEDMKRMVQPMIDSVNRPESVAGLQRMSEEVFCDAAASSLTDPSTLSFGELIQKTTAAMASMTPDEQTDLFTNLFAGNIHQSRGMKSALQNFKTQMEMPTKTRDNQRPPDPPSVD